jgi:2-haloacid dehalogenase
VTGAGPVIFDAYGTLFDPLSLADPLERAFPGRGAALAANWRATQIRHTWLRSLMGAWVDFATITADALRQTLDGEGLPVGDDVVAAVLGQYDTLPTYSDVLPALATLHGSRPLAILTNGDRVTVEVTLDVAGLEIVIPTVLSAEAVRTYKPSPAVYRLATDHFGCDPSDVTFVSGNAWDCAGAGAFGFQVVRIRRSAETTEAVGPPPFATIDDLRELPGLFTP